MYPMLALNLIVIVIPSIAGLGIAFTEWSGYGQPVFIGLENFEALLQDRVFFKALSNNIVWTAIFLTIPIFMGLLGRLFVGRYKAWPNFLAGAVLYPLCHGVGGQRAGMAFLVAPSRWHRSPGWLNSA